MSFSIHHLYGGYGKKEVLRDISFQLPSQGLTVLLGPNGAGKSTLLKILAGLIPPLRGEVLWQKKNLHATSPRERALRIAYVPQHVPDQQINVYDAVLLGRRPHLSWEPGRKDHHLVQETLESLGLSSLAFRSVHTLSGGEHQKVGLARALVQDPSFLLLDEPTNHLDIKNQYECLHILQTWLREKHRGALVAIHDLSLALNFGSCSFVLARGNLLQSGPPKELSENVLSQAYGCPLSIEWINGRAAVFPFPPSLREETPHLKESVCA